MVVFADRRIGMGTVTILFRAMSQACQHSLLDRLHFAIQDGNLYVVAAALVVPQLKGRIAIAHRFDLVGIARDQTDRFFEHLDVDPLPHRFSGFASSPMRLFAHLLRDALILGFFPNGKVGDNAEKGYAHGDQDADRDEQPAWRLLGRLRWRQLHHPGPSTDGADDALADAGGIKPGCDDAAKAGRPGLELPRGHADRGPAIGRAVAVLANARGGQGLSLPCEKVCSQDAIWLHFRAVDFAPDLVLRQWKRG